MANKKYSKKSRKASSRKVSRKASKKMSRKASSKKASSRKASKKLSRKASSRKASSKKASGCVKLSTKKYAKRPGPPFPANQCCDREKMGNDGIFYRSVMNRKGICSWKKMLRKVKQD